MTRRLPLLALLLLAPAIPAAAESQPLPAAAAARPSPSADDNATTPAEAFAAMQKSFQPAKAKGLHVKYQFLLGEPQAGEWWISVDDGACTMGKGRIGSPDVTFECSGADWVQLCNGTLGGFHAYITGRLHMQGSQPMARKMDDLFP